MVATGTSDWDDYAVSSVITFSQQSLAGLVARAKGHRQYYGAVFTEGVARIYRQKNEKRETLAEIPYDYQIDQTYRLTFKVKGDCLELLVDDVPVVRAKDSTYQCGQAGYVVDSGAILGDGFSVTRL